MTRLHGLSLSEQRAFTVAGWRSRHSLAAEARASRDLERGYRTCSDCRFWSRPCTNEWDRGRTVCEVWLVPQPAVGWCNHWEAVRQPGSVLGSSGDGK